MKNLLTPLVCLLAIAVTNAQTDSAKAYLQKGLMEKAAQRYLVASQDFNKAIAFDASYKEAYLQDASVNIEMHRTDLAKADLEKAYVLAPDDQEIIKQLARLYYDFHQYQKAREFAQKCKSCSDAQRIIGLSNYQQENYEDAVAQLQDVFRKDPKDAEVAYAIGRSYWELEEYVNAVAYYQKAVVLEPDRNMWLYELGLLYYNNDDYKDAVILFDKAAAAGYVQSSDFNENLGFACVYSGDFKRGETLLLALLEKRPNNKDLLRGIADAYYKNKMYDKSLELCQKLMMLDANDSRALYQAGMCYQKKGETEKGQQMCDRAIQMDPSLEGLRHRNMTEGL